VRRCTTVTFGPSRRSNPAHVGDTWRRLGRWRRAHAHAYSDADNEGDILKAVQAGTFDVTVLRAGRLADAGATSLAPLQIPFSPLLLSPTR